MIGIDTNVLVRVLTGDDPTQADAAQRFLETDCSPQRPGFVNLIVVCELAWTLDRRYAFARAAIADAIQTLVHAPWLRMQRDDLIWKAAKIYRFASCDFADVLIGLINQETGCRTTATFDRKAARLDTFAML